MSTLFTVNSITTSEFDSMYNVVFNDGCTVTVYSENEDCALGTIMSSYFNTIIRLHPVARSANGRFMSIRGIENELVEAVDQFINRNITISTNTTESCSVIFQDDMEQVDIISNLRGRGLTSTFVDNTDLCQEIEIQEDIVDHPNVMDHSVYRNACVIIFKHFEKCNLNTLNLDQIKKQLEYSSYNLYIKNSLEMFRHTVYKDLFSKLKVSYGNRRFVQKALLMQQLTNAIQTSLSNYN